VPSSRTSTGGAIRLATAASLTLLSVSCYASDIVFIRSSAASSAQQREVETAAEFYGLNLTVVTAASQDERALNQAVGQPATLAVAIAADALPHLDAVTFLQSLKKRPGSSVALLILGVTPETNPGLLKTWSGGAITACKPIAGLAGPARYVYGQLEGFTRQLAGVEVPATDGSPVFFELSEANKAAQITTLQAPSQTFPVFIRIELDHVPVFVECGASSVQAPASRTPSNLVAAFAGIAPAMMFIRYSAGERAWHPTHHLANLTIDDPWLRQSYGSLDYEALLTQMQRHNFHTTIAFIPWNYDRSDPNVASLIRNHPDRFSISVHGDNHDHQEFTKYSNKPLPVQTAAMEQSLARMEAFKRSTGIPYDKVMVFPHSIAPEKTLEALKADDYSATINASNVPMDSPDPPMLPFALRPFTLDFAAFPSIQRYEVPISSDFIAVNEFLENPLFFYAHEDLFADGIDSFNRIADQVNGTQPDAQWASLGDMVRHLYLVRRREDGAQDVLAFSSDFRLENTSPVDSVFYVKKRETDRPAIKSVRVNGNDQPYRFEDGYLSFTTRIPAGAASGVVISYGNDLNLASIDISKTSGRVYLLRTASDFRDIVLSRLAAGRALILFYNKHELTPVPVFLSLSALLACALYGTWRLGKLTGNSRRVKRANAA
jgi:hypothetical protein